MSTSPTIKVARVADGEIVVICEKYFDPHFYVRLEDKDSLAPSESATAKAEAKAKAEAEQAEALKASEEAKAKAAAEAEAVKAEAAEAAKAAEALKAEAEAVTAEAEAAKAEAEAATAAAEAEQPAQVETDAVEPAPVETATVEPVAETVEEANLAIRNAVIGLDSNDASLWTVMGLPTTAAVAAVLGRDITRKEIELAAGDLVRAAATAGNGTGTE